MWISYHTGRKVQHRNTFHAEMCQWTKWTHSIRCLLKEWFYTWSSRDRYMISHFVLRSYVLWKSCASHFLHGFSHTLTQCLEKTFDRFYLNLDHVFIATIILRKNSLQHLTARHLDEMHQFPLFWDYHSLPLPTRFVCAFETETVASDSRVQCSRQKHASSPITGQTSKLLAALFVWLRIFGWPSGSQLLLIYDWSRAKLYLIRSDSSQPKKLACLKSYYAESPHIRRYQGLFKITSCFITQAHKQVV